MFTLNPMKKFYAGFRFGCGCGKKKVKRPTAAVRSSVKLSANASGVTAAKTYQSATTAPASTTTSAARRKV